MGTPASANTVVVLRSEDYDRTRIQQIVAEGMHRLGYRPRGKVFVKPNVVFAYNTAVFGDVAYTTPAFVGASLVALSRVPGVARLDLGENSAIGFPTRLCYQHAGYYEEMKAVARQTALPVRIFCMDEERRDPVFIGGRVHDTLRIARTMARADSKVYLPKLKGHCVSKMTGAVKLNVGICSDDERAIRHDFMLNEKIVDLLAAGYPDLVIMDAIDVGVGNEAFPTRRKLGLVLMGTNPLAVDLVGARLLGLGLDDVPHLQAAVARGYRPASIDEITIQGDLTSMAEVDECARRLLPYDDEFLAWQDIDKELARLQSPMRFKWGPYNGDRGDKCLTGCVMGMKMFLGSIEKHAGAQAFAKAKPVVFVIGACAETIDARGAEVFLIGSCARASVVNASKVTRIDKCFTTAGDMNLAIGHKLGVPSMTRDPAFMATFLAAIGRSSAAKLVGLRYFQDVGHFLSKGLTRRV